jgi:hypothetical protein
MDGHKRSCGCLRRELAVAMCKEGTTHGHQVGRKRTATYGAWANMLTKCRNPNHKTYASYGAQAVGFYENWLSFENFLADMGEAPPGMALCLRDPSGDFDPGNCYWAPRRPSGRKPKP